MKISAIIFALSIVGFLGSCQREQFKGGHLDESKQTVLNEKTVSYHSKVSGKVIAENEKNKDKNEKFRQKRRAAQDKYLTSFNSNESKCKRGKRKTCVAFNGF